MLKQLSHNFCDTIFAALSGLLSWEAHFPQTTYKIWWNNHNMCSFYFSTFSAMMASIKERKFVAAQGAVISFVVVYPILQAKRT